MDRLVMRSSVPEIEELLEVALDAATVVRGGCSRPWEGVTEVRHPQGRVVALAHEVPPEAQVELCDHVAVGHLPTTTSSAFLGLLDVGLGAQVERGMDQPVILASTERPRGHLTVQRVANDDLDHRRQGQCRRRRINVPLVEGERAAEVAVSRR